MNNNTCIVCQTNEVNPMIGKSFCSRICEYLWLRIDLMFLSTAELKRIALKYHESIKPQIDKEVFDHD